MGAVPLLTREREVKIAKHIERGQRQVLKALSRATGIQVMLAATQAAPDGDAGQGNVSVGEAGHSAANGASGFRFV
jgi:sigma-70-like protein